MEIQIARRKNAKLRLANAGVSGSGKSMSSLILAAMFGKKIGVIDSEKGSASLYAGEPGIPEFSVIELDSNPTLNDYRQAIAKFAAAGFDVLVIDSLSHSWAAALEVIDRAGGWTKGGKVVTPAVAGLLQAILSYPGHTICTLRSKTEFAVEKDEKTGKTGMRKIGLAPQIRGDSEYEFTVWLDFTREGTITVSKSRCGDALPMDHVYDRNQDLTKIGERIKGWLSKGDAVSPLSEALEMIKFASDADALGGVVQFLTAHAKAVTMSPADLQTAKAAYLAKKQVLADEVVPV